MNHVAHALMGAASALVPTPSLARLPTFCAALALLASLLPAASAAPDDPVLQAMREEMERSKSQLKLDNVAATYYVEYRVIDADQYSAEASFGALRTDVRSRFRFLRAVVRIGDYKQDSYPSSGEGVSDFMPLDDDMLALRHQLWLAADRAYKAAAQSLTAKQAQLKQFTVDQPVDDFAHAAPVQSIGPLAKLDFDPRPWTRMLQDASALYRNDAQIEAFEASLRVAVTNRYFVNSEGTVVRSGQSLYEINVSGSTQAADGMRLDRSDGSAVSGIKAFPSPQEFIARGAELAATLKKLRDAPVTEEEYRGPVLFSANAAASVFADLVGENVLGGTPGLGRNVRTTGAFAASYKSRVLPDFLSVTDDPTISAFRGQELLGYYEVDDEGVPAQKVSVIEHGTLVNYLIGRGPIRGFPASNGHGRAAIPTNPPGPSLGNLIVRSAQPISQEELRKRLIELCRQHELPYGYFVETLGPRLTPRLFYRVWAKDGHQELVRGAIFGDLDTRALRGGLVAAGDDVYVENRSLNIPHSIVAPSILFDELEVKRATTNKDKLPEYPAP